jgi:activator of HSP90 ATPase
MKNGFTLTTTVPVSPQDLYKAWMTSDGHAAMTGSPAKVDPRPGGAFTAWDGYITGKTLELEPGRRIVQSWRTSEFPASAPHSQLEIVLEAAGRGTKLTLTHTEIPEDQVDSYREGWDESYFQPMKEYFSEAAQ